MRGKSRFRKPPKVGRRESLNAADVAQEVRAEEEEPAEKPLQPEKSAGTERGEEVPAKSPARRISEIERARKQVRSPKAASAPSHVPHSENGTNASSSDTPRISASFPTFGSSFESGVIPASAL